MLLGFISLLLTVSTGVVSKICILASYGKTMLPCKFDYGNKDSGDHRNKEDGDHDRDHDHDKRKLLSLATDMMWRRSLAASSSDDYCSKHVRPPPKLTIPFEQFAVTFLFFFFFP